ncbi:hypothetical protein QM467_18230 [Rhodoblastus sp. 17X3]|uniref:hypothetical protein n=1 Tax=Rhodoblastus sp. 17X3 TaxID=3047026 RepID=UPI0024B7BB72|nr:hypothetical protein [Rhodoblastus sp. 17X3]MDI9849980.1 hypothetical protein [Rhodoblastus sp. 17X3]
MPTAYSAKAQPYLDAIAEGVFQSQKVRDWLIAGTPVESTYSGARILIDEQRNVRWSTKPTKQPFWANYWCGRESNCTCRPINTKRAESDAIFFLENQATSRILAIHIEFKLVSELFAPGQPEAYPMRAACFAKTHESRPTLNAHHDWTTVLFCGPEKLTDPRLASFQRVITHGQAAQMLAGYPRLA